MRTTAGIGLAAALTASLFAAGCGDKTPPVNGVSSIKLSVPNPYGEIPYDRNLQVKKYSIDNLRDVHTLKTGDVIATLDVKYENAKTGDSEEHKIELTRETQDDARILANNLSRYPVVRIPPADYDPRGSMTDIIRVVPTEYGLIIRMPASALRFRDFEEYTVNTKHPDKSNGTIDNSGVHRPWLPKGQQDEKPCISEEPYKSVCDTAQPQPGSKPKPAPKGSAPCKPCK